MEILEARNQVQIQMDFAVSAVNVLTNGKLTVTGTLVYLPLEKAVYLRDTKLREIAIPVTNAHAKMMNAIAEWVVMDSFDRIPLYRSKESDFGIMRHLVEIESIEAKETGIVLKLRPKM